MYGQLGSNLSGENSASPGSVPSAAWSATDLHATTCRLQKLWLAVPRRMFCHLSLVLFPGVAMRAWHKQDCYVVLPEQPVPSASAVSLDDF